MGERNGTQQATFTPKQNNPRRDVFTDRIVGIAVGAVIPLVLLLIPLVNKYLDNGKELGTLQVNQQAFVFKGLYERIDFLSKALINCQEMNKTLMQNHQDKTEKLMETGK
jgi:hypothetical protein